MLFEQKYPDAKPQDEVRCGLLKVETEKPCCICYSRTTFVEMNYEVYLCSEECERKLDEDCCGK